MSLLIAGAFSTLNNKNFESIAMWNGTTLSNPFSASLSSIGYTNQDIVGIARNSSGHIYAAVAGLGLCKYNGTSWTVIHSFGFSLFDICIDSSNNVYYCGEFEVFKCTSGDSYSKIGETATTATYPSLALDGSNNLYFTGNFSSISGVSASHIAKWNGSSWSALGSGLPSNGEGTAVICVGSNVYAGFTDFNWSPDAFLKKWNGSSWSDCGSSVPYAIISNFAVDGTDVYSTWYYDNTTDVRKWNGSTLTAVGTVSGLFSGSAWCLEVYSGYLYVGIKNSGSIPLPSYPILNNDMGSISGGLGFSLAKYQLSGGSGEFISFTNENPSGFYGNKILSLTVSGGNLYITGFFDFALSSAGQTSVKSMATWNGSALTKTLGATQYVDPSDLPTTVEIVAHGCSGRVIISSGWMDKVWYGESSTSVTAPLAMMTSGGTWSTVSTNASTIYDIKATASKFYVACSGTSIGGVTILYIAQYNGTSWSSVGSTSGTNGVIRVVCVDPVTGDLYAAGDFTTICGVSATRIARWNGSAWSALGTGIGSGAINCLHHSGTDLYVGGNFTTAGGVTVNKIARWNGSTWSAMGTGTVGVSGGQVYAIAYNSTDSTLYVAGGFTSAGGTSRDRIAKYSPSGNSWSTWGVTATDFQYKPEGFRLAKYDGAMYVAFTPQTAMLTKNSESIYKWTGSAWQGLGSSFGVNPHELIYGLANELDADLPPTPGNSGTITTSNIQSTSITLNWTKATDDITAQANLQYLAYYSLSSTMNSVSDVEANGTPSGSYTTDINTKTVGSLTEETPYYFNVIVKDAAGNKAAYTKKQETTLGIVIEVGEENNEVSGGSATWGSPASGLTLTTNGYAVAGGTIVLQITSLNDLTGEAFFIEIQAGASLTYSGKTITPVSGTTYRLKPRT